MIDMVQIQDSILSQATEDAITGQILKAGSTKKNICLDIRRPGQSAAAEGTIIQKKIKISLLTLKIGSETQEIDPLGAQIEVVSGIGAETRTNTETEEIKVKGVDRGVTAVVGVEDHKKVTPRLLQREDTRRKNLLASSTPTPCTI